MDGEMSGNGFVHLHLHSEYSLLDGACRISDIPKAAKEAGQNAVALTDHGVMYGVVQFYKACKAEGIKPIIGCEVYVAKRSMQDRERELDSGSSHLILLVKNETGWKNLIFLVSKAFTEGFYSKPRIDNELLEKHAEGLICLSACLSGYIPRCIVAGDYDRAEEYAVHLDKVFGRGNFYLELQSHSLRDDRVVNDAILRISEKTGIPLAATNDVHYIKKTDAATQAVLMCIQTGSTVNDPGAAGLESDEFYFRSTEEMKSLFEAYPDACANTQKIADMCSFDFEFGKTKLPRYILENGEDPEDYLRRLVYDGLEDRVRRGHIVFDEAHPREMYTERIEYELSVISKMGYSEYYLIVWDFVHHSKESGIPVGPGRGSGAGSIAAYLIGITDIDSIRFGLLFERFLNPERVSMPDFDIDFCYDRRDEAIAYVREKYGEDHTAQIVTFGTLAARAAIRDVGRALGMSYADTDTVAKMIPQELNITLKKAMEENPKLNEAYKSDSKVKKLIDTAAALEGMPRHASTHAAGVVITALPVTDYVPVSVNGGVTVTQFDMDTIAELGLLKFDFLALRYLTIIDNAEKQIREKKPGFDLTKVPIDDIAVYDMLSAGKCDGVFQLESGGMRQMLTQLKPTSLDDIIAAIALYRPGPMDSIPKYIEARHDPSKIHYCTDRLAPILDLTYGCIVYQEQVMQIFREIAGYSFGHADVVRRAISKKKQGVLESERQSFIDGAAARGIVEADAVALFEDIVSFANYAFNKSHAAAYAVLSYRTAYLKLHYPKEYISALLTSVQSYTDKLTEYIAECANLGIPVLPPSINRSMSQFHVDGNGIRFGLAAIKSIGEGFIDRIIRERERGGEFTDFDDFIARTSEIEINKRQLEVLIKSGAMDGLGANRRQLLAVYEMILDRRAKPLRNDGLEGQIGMFDSASLPKMAGARIEYPQFEDYTAKEKLMLERESTGMCLSGHLLDDYSICLSKLKCPSISSVKGNSNGSFDGDTDESGGMTVPSESVIADKTPAILAGIITKITLKQTKSGGRMAFVTIEDTSASIEVLVFPKILEKYGHLVIQDAAVAFRGTLSVREEEDTKLIAEGIVMLAQNSEYKDAQTDIKPEARKVPQSVQKSTEENVGTATANQASPQTSQIPQAQNPSVQIVRKVYLRVKSESDSAFIRAKAVCEIFGGTVPATFYSAEKKEYLSPPVCITATPFVIGELRELLGDENVVVK